MLGSLRHPRRWIRKKSALKPDAGAMYAWSARNPVSLACASGFNGANTRQKAFRIASHFSFGLPSCLLPPKFSIGWHITSRCGSEFPRCRTWFTKGSSIALVQLLDELQGPLVVQRAAVVPLHRICAVAGRHVLDAQNLAAIGVGQLVVAVAQLGQGP